MLRVWAAPGSSRGLRAVSVHPTSGLTPTLSPCPRASLWSSCVVLPLLALTWMSAVLAMTDRRSILFQVLFAVFNSVQGFVIITVHGFLRREVGRGRGGTPLPAGDPHHRLCPRRSRTW